MSDLLKKIFKEYEENDIADKQKALKCLKEAKQKEIAPILKELFNFVKSNKETIEIECKNSYIRMLYIKIAVALRLFIKHNYDEIYRNLSPDYIYDNLNTYSYCTGCYSCSNCTKFHKQQTFRPVGLSISKKRFKKPDRRMLRYYEKNGIKWQGKINGVQYWSYLQIEVD